MPAGREAIEVTVAATASLAGRLLALGLALMLAACTAGGSARDPGTLVVLEAGDANSLDPIYANNYYAIQDYAFVNEPLVNFGDGFALIPWLATAWTHSADGLHWTFRLRRGVTWSDGAPFDARDVAFTWRTYLDPKAGFLYAGWFDYIKKVTAIDSHTVRFDLSHPSALFLGATAANAPIIPEHVLGKFRPEQLRSSGFGEHPVGTGPYMLARWQHDEEMLFDANPHWWHGPIRVKHLEFRVLLDDQARSEAMETGAADFDDAIGSSAYAALHQDGARVEYLRLPDLFTQFIMVNFSNPALAERTVRRAMLYGWDRQALLAGLYHGDGAVANGVTPPALTRWFDKDVRTYGYDPGRARALLDAAGWTPGRDGVREKNGRRLAFDLILGATTADAAEYAAEFQADMRAIGVGVTVKALDYATFIDLVDERKFELALSGWGGTPPDPDQFTLLESKQIPPVGNNDMGYANARVDRDVTLGLATIDDARRKPYYDDMQRAVADDPPVLFSDYRYYRAAYLPRVHFDVAKALPDSSIFRDVWNWELDPQ